MSPDAMVISRRLLMRRVLFTLWINVVLTFSQLRKAFPDFEIKGPLPKDRTVVALAAQTQQPPSNPTPGLQRSNTVASSSEDLSAKPSATSVNASSLAREKNRVTLRSYLHGLLSSSVIANSPVLKSFLLSGPTTLSPEEEEDSRHREDADRVREEGRKRFAKEVASRVDGLRSLSLIHI